MSETRRLDVELVRRGLANSRNRAQQQIRDGNVKLGGKTELKPSALCGEGDEIEIEADHGYTSRGGLKLEHALAHFKIDVRGVRALDLGASTGGFVQCLLNAGAASVLAVDVGTGQLDSALRLDPRVVSMEGTDARTLTLESVGAVELAVCDVSFISIKHILPKIRELLSPDGQAVVLIKPQFEAGIGKVGKNGVIKERKVHESVLQNMLDAVKLNGFTCIDMTESPIKGGSGNIEFFMHIAFQGEPWRGDVGKVVAQAHFRLNRR